MVKGTAGRCRHVAPLAGDRAGETACGRAVHGPLLALPALSQSGLATRIIIRHALSPTASDEGRVRPVVAFCRLALRNRVSASTAPARSHVRQRGEVSTEPVAIDLAVGGPTLPQPARMLPRRARPRAGCGGGVRVGAVACARIPRRGGADAGM